MKKYRYLFSFFLFIFCSTIISGQIGQLVYYFDDDLNIVPDSAAKYVVVGMKENNRLKVSSYKLPSRTIIMKGYFIDSTLAVKDGLFTYYDSLGIPESEGLYRNNLEEGLWLSWKNRTSDSVYYEKAMEVRKISITYHEGSEKLESRTSYDNKKGTGETLRWDTSGVLLSKTFRIRSDEETEFYYPNGKVKEIERRPFGQSPISTYYSQTGKNITKQVLKEREQDELMLSDWPNGGDKPAYPGGREEFFDFIKRNFKPIQPMTLTVGSSITMKISFMLDKSGNPKDINVEGGWQNDRITLLSVIRRMPSWKMNGLESYGPINVSLHLTMIY